MHLARNAAFTLLLVPGLARAHAAADLASDGDGQGWWVALLVALTLGYLLGLRQLRARPRRMVGDLQIAAFLLAMAGTALALASPLDTLAARRFSAHMVQHLLLMLFIAPLLVVGRPGIALLGILPLASRRRTGRAWHRAMASVAPWLMNPVSVWLLNTITLWFWHLPAPYDLALRHEGIHILEHLSFVTTSLMMWRLLLGATGARRLRPGASILFIATQAAQSGMLGALLAFSTRPLYGAHQLPLAGTSLSALEDQQLAGLIMWIPANLGYLGAMCLLLYQWLESAASTNPRHRDGNAPSGQRMAALPCPSQGLATDIDSAEQTTQQAPPAPGQRLP